MSLCVVEADIFKMFILRIIAIFYHYYATVWFMKFVLNAVAYLFSKVHFIIFANFSIEFWCSQRVSALCINFKQYLGCRM